LEFSNLAEPTTIHDGADGSLSNGVKLQEFIDDNRFLGVKNVELRLANCTHWPISWFLPSRTETWGNVVDEALCFGLPVIVSNQVGAGVDLVAHGETGLISPVGDERH